MAQQSSIELSLKGGSAVWRGQEDASYATELGGAVSWKELRNVYLSKDGTEIKRMPGSATGSQMFLGEHIWDWEGTRNCITAVSTASTVQITLADNHDATTGIYIYISGHNVITTGYYVMTRVSDTAFTIPFSTSDTSPSQTAGTVWIQRVKHVHAMMQVDGVPCVVAETRVFPDSGGDERNNIGTWVGSKMPDVTQTDAGAQNYDIPDTPNTAENNRGDTGVVIWPCPTMRALTWNGKTALGEKGAGGEKYGNNIKTTGSWLGRTVYAWDMSIYGRCQIDSMMNRLLIAVPGHGVMMEADIGLRKYPFKSPSQSALQNSVGELNRFAGKLPSPRWTKALGIPKGVIFDAKPIASDDGWLAETKFVYVAVGFVDPLTGEAGLPSETIKVTAPAGAARIVEVSAFISRQILPETIGLNLVLYVSTIDAVTSTVLRPIMVIPPSGMSVGTPKGRGHQDEHYYWGHEYHDSRRKIVLEDSPDPYYTNSVEVGPGRYPILSQYPTGASWVRAVQSRMIKGGDISSTGDEYEVLLTDGHTEGTGKDLHHPDKDLYYIRFLNFQDVGKERWDTSTTHPPLNQGTDPHWTLQGSRASLYAFPNSYSGHQLQQEGIQDRGPNLGADIGKGRIGTEQNRQETWIRDAPRNWKGVLTNNFDFIGVSTWQYPGKSYLKLDPNRIQYSEQAHPGVVPAVNNLFIDNLKGRRTTAGARVGNQCLVMTDRATYSTGGAMSPRQVNTSVLSLEYGCVASSSVVEFPGGAAWLSREGPVVFSGSGVQWIGAGIREKWKDFKRDSLGMMSYAQGAYDSQRDLVIWTLREDREQTDFALITTDSEKAKVPSDTLLIWAWRSNVWTISYRNAGSEVHAIAAMDSILSRDSSDRVDNIETTICAMHQNDGATASVYPIAVWEDKWADRVKVPEKVTATANKTPGSDNFVVGAVAIDATAINEGDMAFIRSPTNELRCWGDVSALVGTAVPITVDGASMTNADWKTDDVMEGKIFHMRLQSNMMRLGRKHKGMVIAGVSLRHEVKRDHDPDSEGALAWARVQIESEDGTKYQMSQDYWGDSISTGVSRHTSNRLVNVGEFKVYIDLVGNSQISLRDISVEVIPR